MGLWCFGLLAYMTPRKQISKFTCADSDTNGFPGALGSK